MLTCCAALTRYWPTPTPRPPPCWTAWATPRSCLTVLADPDPAEAAALARLADLDADPEAAAVLDRLARAYRPAQAAPENRPPRLFS